MSSPSFLRQRRLIVALVLLSVPSDAMPILPRASTSKSSGSRTTNNYYYNQPTSGDWWHRNKAWVISVSLIVGAIVLALLGLVLFKCLGCACGLGSRFKERVKERMVISKMRKEGRQGGDKTVETEENHPAPVREHDRESLATTAVDHEHGGDWRAKEIAEWRDFDPEHRKAAQQAENV